VATDGSISEIQGGVGNGDKIKFWKEGWIDHIPLMESFPDLFIISNSM